MDNQDINNNNNDNLQSPMPKKRFGKATRVFFLIIFLIIIIAVALVYLSFFGKVNKQAVGPGAQQSAIQQIDYNSEVKTDQTLLFAQAKIKIPAITEQQTVPSSSLPSDFLAFVNFSSTTINSLQVEQITLASGSGYRINYTIPSGDLSSVYGNLTRTASQGHWTTVSGHRASVFGLLELQNANYNARVSLSQVSASSIEATIIIFPK